MPRFLYFLPPSFLPPSIHPHLCNFIHSLSHSLTPLTSTSLTFSLQNHAMKFGRHNHKHSSSSSSLKLVILVSFLALVGFGVVADLLWASSSSTFSAFRYVADNWPSQQSTTINLPSVNLTSHPKVWFRFLVPPFLCPNFFVLFKLRLLCSQFCSFLLIIEHFLFELIVVILCYWLLS